MSDHPDVALADLSCVANDVWLDALFWIDRVEVGTKFALIDARFGRLVATHLNLRKWRLGELGVHRAPSGWDRGGTAAVTVMDDNALINRLPLATCPAPGGVIGFSAIYIWYVDLEVIAFLQCLQRVINRGIAVQFTIHSTDLRCWAVMAQRIWPLISHAVLALNDMKAVNFALLCRHVSPNVLFDCANLRAITNTHMFPIRPPPSAVHINALLNPPEEFNEKPKNNVYRWLHTPRKDGRPKIVTIRKWRKPQWASFMPSLITFFIAPSAVPVNFLVICHIACKTNFQKMERENEETDERLTLNARVPADAVIVRCRNGTDQRTVNAWEKEANQMLDNLLCFTIKDSDIGPELLAELMANE
ncbi:hypothetical protein niasHS_014033 [Heterodera schachtii]|uniref:Uncharacterized protein n=1 Tax=Heterodera schachtii TaxID=97005 RepID=A0ABD2IQK9_HETSC